MSIVAPPHVSRVKDQNLKTTQHPYHRWLHAVEYIYIKTRVRKIKVQKGI